VTYEPNLPASVFEKKQIKLKTDDKVSVDAGQASALIQKQADGLSGAKGENRCGLHRSLEQS